MEQLFYRAELMDNVEDIEMAYTLAEDRALVGEANDHLLIVSKALAYRVVSRPEFLPVPEDETWLLTQSEERAIVAAYMHSIAEICGHVAIAGGQRVAFHFHLDMPASLLAQLTPNAAMPAELLVDLANVETLRREGWLFTFGVPLMPGPVSVDLRPHG